MFQILDRININLGVLPMFQIPDRININVGVLRVGNTDYHLIWFLSKGRHLRAIR